MVNTKETSQAVVDGALEDAISDAGYNQVVDGRHGRGTEHSGKACLDFFKEGLLYYSWVNRYISKHWWSYLDIVDLDDVGSSGNITNSVAKGQNDAIHNNENVLLVQLAGTWIMAIGWWVLDHRHVEMMRSLPWWLQQEIMSILFTHHPRKVIANNKDIEGRVNDEKKYVIKRCPIDDNFGKGARVCGLKY